MKDKQASNSVSRIFITGMAMGIVVTLAVTFFFRGPLFEKEETADHPFQDNPPPPVGIVEHEKSPSPPETSLGIADDRISIEKVDVEAGESGSRTVLIHCVYAPTDEELTVMPRFVGVGSNAVARSVIDESGRVGEDMSRRCIMNANGSRGASFDLRLSVPETAKTLKTVEAELLVYQEAKSRVMLLVNDILEAQGKTFTAEGYKLTVLQVRQEGDELKIVTQLETPKVLEDEPLYWPGSLLKRDLLAGSGRVARSAASGNLDEYRERYRLDGCTPKTYRLILIPAIREERRPFTLTDVSLPEIPMHGAGRNDSHGPRGPLSVEVDGFTFTLKNVTLTQTKTTQRRGGECTLRLSLHLPDMPGLVAVTSIPAERHAETDTGEILEADFFPSSPSSIRRDKEQRLLMKFACPAKPADRLTVLSGACVCLVAQGYEQATFPLSAESKSEEQTANGVTLLSATPSTKGMLVEWSMDKKLLPTGSFNGWTGAMRCRVLDSEGKMLGISEGCGLENDGRITRLRLTVPYEEGRPASIEIQYPSKGRKLRIPFQFEDVGLPAESGTKHFGREVF